MRKYDLKSVVHLGRFSLSLFALITLTLTTAQSTGGNSITTPDPADSVGYYSSLVLDGNGYPVVSYYDYVDYDNDNYDLKVLHCNDPNCSGGDESIVSPDTVGIVGQWTSLALDGDGYPVVSYFDNTNNSLKLLHCNDPNCSGGDESVTSPDTGGLYTSLALDGNGYPVVSHYDYDNLKLLHCNDPNCSGDDESISAPDTAGIVGAHTSLALDGDGYPVVSYWDITNRDLKLLHCNDPNCSGDDESITSPDMAGSVGQYTSLALDGNGYPVVTYFDDTDNNVYGLKLLHCNDPNCSGDDESITVMGGAAGFVGGQSSLVLDSSGYPVFSYHASSGLKLLHCNDPNCIGSDESVAGPDTGFRAGSYSSLALDGNGFPVVSYNGGGFNIGGLKLLHCATVNCNNQPMAEAGGPYSGAQNFSISLNGASASDLDDDPLNYSWEVDSINCTFSDATALNPSLTCSSLGTFTATLTVDDGQDSVSDTATVSVIKPEFIYLPVLQRPAGA